jgi:Na+-driven multidrug efflux pump
VVIFTILPAWGLSNAAATLVGQNLGAGQPDRAEKSVWTAAFYTMVFLTSISLVLFCGAEQIIRIFSSQPEVISNGINCLRCISVGYVFFAYGMVISQSFNGAGDTKTPTYVNLVAFWGFQIPLGYMLATVLKWGPLGVYISEAAAFTMMALISIYLFRKGRWKLVKV